MTDMAIRYRGVSKVYPDGTTAVDHLDLDVPAGSLTVFVGPSGCGKTTSLRMLNRMVEPTSGAVEINGQDVSSIPAAQLRRSMGYVMQQSGLLPHRTVEDNIATVPRLNGVPRRKAREDARALLASVGLDDSLATRYPAQLSGGQQQRVGVARALAADPPILLMDEPFSAVDPVVRQDLQRELLDLQKRLHRTIVFVTHDIDEAVLLGNRVAVFARGGRLAQYATPEELLRSPADDFVADFIGRDRGFRSLGFDSATVALQPVAAIFSDTGERTLLGPGTASSPQGSDSAGGARTAPWDDAVAPEWLLVVDGRRHPLGWLPVSAAGEPAPRDELRVGGTLWQDGGSLRTALDAALSSPSGQAVAVDHDGAVAGVVPGGVVMRAIEQSRSARYDRAERP
ncbi:proline/glycine betaine ABC transporter ATP-binding protein [Kocuria varians]|uniref:ABC-type quaternary amine transporter n=1 Tax=Kocuria varians TaxID=1272 RepID=A0A4Y4D4S2_KOCVA|nr:ATP-binding cassette domain-containing protein [Kocuria varians]GED00202.1 proline/glycine betaine ABC transporter ATP-binding protein [Kocuria varians]